MKDKVVHAEESLLAQMQARREELYRQEMARAASFSTGLWAGMVIGVALLLLGSLASHGVALAAVVMTAAFFCWMSSRFRRKAGL